MKIVTLKSGFSDNSVIVLQMLADMDIAAAWEAFPTLSAQEEAVCDYFYEGHKSAYLFSAALEAAGLAKEIKDAVHLSHPSIDYATFSELDSTEEKLVAPRAEHVAAWFENHLRVDALKEAKDLNSEGKLTVAIESHLEGQATLHSLAYKHAQRSPSPQEAYERVYHALKTHYYEFDPEVYFVSADTRGGPTLKSA